MWEKFERDSNDDLIREILFRDEVSLSSVCIQIAGTALLTNKKPHAFIVNFWTRITTDRKCVLIRQILMFESAQYSRFNKTSARFWVWKAKSYNIKKPRMKSLLYVVQKWRRGNQSQAQILSILSPFLIIYMVQELKKKICLLLLTQRNRIFVEN